MPGRAAKRRRLPPAGESTAARPTDRNRRLIDVEKADQSRLGFFDLPPEIRIVIYSLALSPSNGGAVSLVGGAKIGNDLALGMLRSCQAVNKEATGVFYKENVFRVDVQQCTDDMITEEMKACWVATAINAGRPCLTPGGWNWRDTETYSAWRDWTKLPGVYDHLGIVGAKRIALMRSVVLAYHAHPPVRRDANDIPEFPGVSDLALEIQVLKKKPFYRVVISRDLTKSIDGLAEQRAAEQASRYIEASLKMRGIRTFCRYNILDFAETLWNSCNTRRLDGTVLG